MQQPRRGPPWGLSRGLPSSSFCVHSCWADRAPAPALQPRKSRPGPPWERNSPARPPAGRRARRAAGAPNTCTHPPHCIRHRRDGPRPRRVAQRAPGGSRAESPHGAPIHAPAAARPPAPRNPRTGRARGAAPGQQPAPWRGPPRSAGGGGAPHAAGHWEAAAARPRPAPPAAQSKPAVASVIASGHVGPVVPHRTGSGRRAGAARPLPSRTRTPRAPAPKTRLHPPAPAENEPRALAGAPLPPRPRRPPCPSPGPARGRTRHPAPPPVPRFAIPLASSCSALHIEAPARPPCRRAASSSVPGPAGRPASGPPRSRPGRSRPKFWLRAPQPPLAPSTLAPTPPRARKGPEWNP
jgi:hypothetical protein